MRTILYRSCVKVVLVTKRLYYMASLLYTAFHFRDFGHASFYKSCKETRRTAQESCDATNTITRYTRGIIASQVFSFSYLVYPCEYHGLQRANVIPFEKRFLLFHSWALPSFRVKVADRR